MSRAGAAAGVIVLVVAALAPLIFTTYFVGQLLTQALYLGIELPAGIPLFATGLAGPVDLCPGPDGSLYYLNRNAWVKDDLFRPKTGSVHPAVSCVTRVTTSPIDSSGSRPSSAAVYGVSGILSSDWPPNVFEYPYA